MPGSLLLGNDSYSDVSDSSNRSFDSKIGGKKVSFNKAVRVKQYNWKPDLEVSTSEHLTLPSNRFWFKVYKNKNENSISNSYDTETPLQNTWEEINMDCLHNSLSPIAEVEDQDIIGLHTNRNSSEENHFESNKYEVNFNDYEDAHHYPTEPPVDYINDLRLSANRDLNGVKQVWRSDNSNNHRFDSSNDHINSYDKYNANDIAHQYGSLSESRNDLEATSLNSKAMLNKVGLPPTNFKNGCSLRRSLKRFDDSNISQSRERRSRSHDDHTDNDNRCKLLRKTDKSVSTDDLNLSANPTNRFFKGSRDVATQCYGTLTRTNNASTLNNSSLLPSQAFSSINTTERLKNFKSPRPSVLHKETINTNSTANQKKDYSLEKFSHRNRSGENILSKFSPSKKQYGLNQNALININGYSKPLARTQTNIANIMQRRAAKTFSSSEDTNSPVSRETNKSNVTNKQSNNITVGYLRGRQIPLSEVNTNTNRKYLSRNNIGYNQRQISYKDNENTDFTTKSVNHISSGNQPKRYMSTINNNDRRNIRNNLNSGKSFISSFSEGDSSMIDWSLSGFQLASKPENLATSMSDSEYTVHRRPPLLMYIPGVSHHDRPAIEDDRLSALSDVSRSEIREEFGNSSTDFHRRQSLREGKSKWMKWRSKR